MASSVLSAPFGAVFVSPDPKNASLYHFHFYKSFPLTNVNIFLIFAERLEKTLLSFVHIAKRRFSFEIPSNGAVFRPFVHSGSQFFVQKVKS